MAHLYRFGRKIRVPSTCEVRHQFRTYLERAALIDAWRDEEQLDRLASLDDIIAARALRLERLGTSANDLEGVRKYA